MNQVVKDIGRGVEVVGTIALAVAAAYSAISARNTADIARQAAEAAQGAVVASNNTVAIAREWFETIARPLATPMEFRLDETGPSTVDVSARLREIADVPTAIRNLCVWQATELPSSEDRRQYRAVPLREGLFVYRDLYQTFRYPTITIQHGEPQTVYLSAIYTIAREGATAAETWRAETEVYFVPNPDDDRRFNFIIRNTDVYALPDRRARC